MTEYLQDGKTIFFINDTDANINYLDIVPGEHHITIAAGDIKIGEAGSLYTEGVFTAPCAKVAIKFMENVYYDKANKVLTNVAAGNIPAGYSVVAKKADETECAFKLASLPLVAKA